MKMEKLFSKHKNVARWCSVVNEIKASEFLVQVQMSLHSKELKIMNPIIPTVIVSI